MAEETTAAAEILGGQPVAGTPHAAAKAHSHGAGAPSGHRIERLTSRDPDAFGVPTGREEDWRFTPLVRMRPLLEPFTPTGKVAIELTADGGAGESSGVTLAQVPGDDRLVGSVLTPADRVSALAMAQVGTAHVLTVPKAADVAEPVWLRVRGESGLAYAHIVVDAEAESRAVVIIDHVGSTTLAANLEIRVGDNAELTLISIQDWADDTVHAEAQAAGLGRDARLRHIVVTLGGNLVRLTPSVSFTAPGGDAELVGLSFGDAGQHQEHRLYVDHSEPHCRSNVMYKCALQGDKAHAVWIGDVVIRPTAEGTNTYELNRNLVLSEGARADSVPNLEIETGEIEGAGHASATGRFDDEQLFYLMSRGVPESEARRLVVRGFFAEVIRQIGVPELEQRLTDAIEAELAKTPEEN